MAGRYRRPVTPAERQRREDAHADKLTALHGRLTDAVADLHSGAQWRAWLDVAGRFHAYSFNNVLAISIQRPDATLVAGYQTWQTLGRQVGKGETGIQILAPIVRRAADDGDRTPGGEAAGRGENTARPAAGGPGSAAT
ncbi:MAG: ArdC family protein, partial [Nocardioidaceae bacterium]